MNVSRHNADFTLIRSDDTGTVGADKTSFVLLNESRFDTDHILCGNTLTQLINFNSKHIFWEKQWLFFNFSNFPSVMQTARGISASIASRTALAANFGGT